MKPLISRPVVNRRILLLGLAAPVVLSGLRLTAAQAQLPGGPPAQGALPSDPLASWN